MTEQGHKVMVPKLDGALGHAGADSGEGPDTRVWSLSLSRKRSKGKSSKRRSKK